MRILLSAIALFICGSVFSQGGIYTPVNPTTYGEHQRRLKADSVQHIPEKDSLFKNTIDTTAQLFINKKDSLVWGYTRARGFFKVEGSVGTVTWGTLVGTLSDQLDLQAALDLKLNIADSSIDGGYYPYSTNPKGYLVAADISQKVDSVTTNSDSTILRYWKNGVSTDFYNFSSGLTGGDTTVFETVLDSTAQPGQRVLFGGGAGKIKSDGYFLFDSINNKLMINHFNISAGGPNTKLFVNGNSTLAGAVTMNSAVITNAPTTSAGSYDILTRNTSGGAVEKISSSTFQSVLAFPYTTNKYLTGYNTFGSFLDTVRTSLSLTTTGISGAATYNNSTGVFNIPNYNNIDSLFGKQDNIGAENRSFDANQHFWYVQNSNDIFLQADGGTGVNSWYSQINLWSGYLDLQQQRGNSTVGETEIAMQPVEGLGDIRMYAKAGSSFRSDIWIRSDYLRFIPSAGILYIDTLSHSTDTTGKYILAKQRGTDQVFTIPLNSVGGGSETDPLSIHLTGTSVLTGNVIVTQAANTVTWNGSTTGTQFLSANSSTGTSLKGTTTGGGTAVWGETSGNGWGGFFKSATGNGIETDGGTGAGIYSHTSTGIVFSGINTGNRTANLPVFAIEGNWASTNSNEKIATFTRTSSGTVADGISGSIDMLIENSSAATLTNRITSRLTTVNLATRTSEFDIDGFNSGTQEVFLRLQHRYIMANNLADTVAYLSDVRAGAGSGTTRLDQLLAANTTNTINNVSYTQEWQWNSLAGASALKLSTTSTAAASDLQRMLEISMTGNNATASQTTWGAYISNTHGGSGNNIAAQFNASGGSVNKGIVTSGTEYGIEATSTGTGTIAGYFHTAAAGGTAGDFDVNTSAGTDVAVQIFSQGVSDNHTGIQVGVQDATGRNDAIKITSGEFLLPEVVAPGTPTSGFGTLYVKSDGKIYYKGDGGTEYDLTTGSGGGSLNVKESDGTPSIAATSILTFHSEDFVLTDLGSNEMQVRGLVHSIADENLVGGAGNSFAAITAGSAFYNTGFGDDVLNALTTGDANTVFGSNVFRRITTQSKAIGFGRNVFQRNVAGAGIASLGTIGIGESIAPWNANENMIIGFNSFQTDLDSATSASGASVTYDNIAIGWEMMQALRKGFDNVGVGFGNFDALDSGNYNNGFGQFALQFLINGEYNDAIGWKAGYGLVRGNQNIMIGNESGFGSDAYMNSSIFIGARSRYTGQTNLFNVIVIGDSALVGNQDNIAVIGRSGTFLAVGRSTATESIHTDGAIVIGDAVATTDGTIRYTGSDFEGRKSGAWASLTGGGGYTNLTQFVAQNNWKTFYSNGSGDVQELSVGAAGSLFMSTGTSAAPAFTSDLLYDASAFLLKETGGGQTMVQTGYGGLYFNPNTSNVQLTLENDGGVEGGFFTHVTGKMYFGTWSNHPLYFEQNNADAGIINTSREWQIGSATDQGDFITQFTGGIYRDITSKTWSVQGTVYNSSAAIVALGIDTTTGLIYRKTASGGSGETNTASNLGGGLANYSTKVGVDLQFNSFASADFDLASNLITIDATKWLTISSAAATYQPLDADLTTLAGLTATTDNFLVSVSSAWASRTPAQVRTTLGLVIGTNVQAWDADLDTWATVTPGTGVATFLATPSSANLISAITDETGTGALVFGTSPTLTTPKIANAGYIADANGNELIIFTTTASAVNEWTFANGATGVNPLLTASGETNVGLDFKVKGTGVFNLLATTSGPTDLRLYEDADNGTNYNSIIAQATLGSNRTATLPDATGTLVLNDNTATLTSKSIDWANNTMTLTVAQLNTALTTYDLPTAVSTSGKWVKSDGTNLIMSTATLPEPTATAGTHMVGDGTNWTAVNERTNWTTFVVSGSNATTTGSTLVDITGLTSGTLTNATKYEVEAWLDVSTSAVTTGTQYAFFANGTGGAAVYNVLIQGTTTTNAQTSATQSSATQQGTFLTTSSTAGVIYLHGFVTTRGSGTATISVQHLKVTSGTSTVLIGSKFSYRLAN